MNTYIEQQRKEYGRLVHKARVAKDMTQYDLAAECGLGMKSKGTICNIERGHRWPSYTMALTLAEVLGIPVPVEREYGESYSPMERDVIAYKYLNTVS